VGIFTPTLSNQVDKTVDVDRLAVTLTVEGVLTTVVAAWTLRLRSLR
jgi:hypothetical protein